MSYERSIGADRARRLLSLGLARTRRERLESFIRQRHPTLLAAWSEATCIGSDSLILAHCEHVTRQYVWSCIRRHQASLARLLESEEFLELKHSFGASVGLPTRSVYRALRRQFLLTQRAA